MRISLHRASVALLAAVGANAHTTVHAVWLNDVDQGLGCTSSGGTASNAYIRCPPNNNPVKVWLTPNGQRGTGD